MTKQQATQFERFSEINAEILESICTKCEAYKDWFTFKRWEAQGEMIARGQHGTRITVIVKTNDNSDKKEDVQTAKVWHAVVFCRHQLAK